MDKRFRQYNVDLDFHVSVAALRLNVLYVNYEAPIPDWAYGLHSHSSYELHFIPRGRGELKIGPTDYSIVPGTFYLTGPGVMHEQRADHVDPMSEFCLNFEVLPPRPGDLDLPTHVRDEQKAISAVLASTSFWFGRDSFSTVSLFEEVFAEMETRGLGYYSRIQNLLALIIINAIRSFAPNVGVTEELPRKGLQDARRFLIDRYFYDESHEHNRDELAALIGTSVRQLNRVLQDYYGLSFTEKLTRSRLEKALVFLQSSDLDLLSISEKLGFASQSYFSTRFREVYGTTPSHFRKKS